jgi:hypothetical protein
MSTLEHEASGVAPAAATADEVLAGETRLGELVGDRPCAKCHFNLAGQTIVRERHYGMLMVRCPECGTPAALQEYPLLGRWAGRMGYVLAALWMCAMMGIVAVSALVAWGMSETMAQQMSSPYTQHVQKVWNDYINGSGPPNPYAYMNYQQNQQWWDSLDKKQLFLDAGGWRGAIAWNALFFSFNTLLLMGGLGAIMAVAMPHVRWRGRVVLVLLVGVLAGAFWWVSATMSQNVFAYYGGAWGAWRTLGLVLAPMGIGIAIAALMVGLCVGRPLARGLVVLLLPPRLRGPLAFIWRADGKRMPRAA